MFVVVFSFFKYKPQDKTLSLDVECLLTSFFCRYNKTFESTVSWTYIITLCQLHLLPRCGTIIKTFTSFLKSQSAVYAAAKRTNMCNDASAFEQTCFKPRKKKQRTPATRPYIRKQTSPVKQTSNVPFVTSLCATANGAFKLYTNVGISTVNGN